LIPVKGLPGVTVVLDHEKAMLTERLNRLRRDHPPHRKYRP
jgi:hypothetical protein